MEGEFDIAMKVIESGLAVRDKEGIGLRWPLAKAEISCEDKLSKGVQEIIAKQLNVKGVSMAKGALKVVLDTKMNAELEAEGYAREVARVVQAARKRAGLQKGELVDIALHVGEKLRKMLEKHHKFLAERTNAKSLSIDDKTKIEEGKNSIKIRDEMLSLEFLSLGRNK